MQPFIHKHHTLANCVLVIISSVNSVRADRVRTGNDSHLQFASPFSTLALQFDLQQPAKPEKALKYHTTASIPADG